MFAKHVRPDMFNSDQGSQISSEPFLKAAVCVALRLAWIAGNRGVAMVLPGSFDKASSTLTSLIESLWFAGVGNKKDGSSDFVVHKKLILYR